MQLSVIITTRNEAENIANCLRAFDGVRDRVETIVVDNDSSDNTRQIAESLGAQVYVCGPERCAQRNFGCKKATSEWVVILDADMIVPAELLEEMLSIVERPWDSAQPNAYWIPEIRTGSGLRTKARNFERSFYDGTCIDALRLMRRSLIEQTGGYDEKLMAGGEDWDLDIRILATGAQCAVLSNPLIHNERQLTLKRMLKKKAYYSKTLGEYQAKWPNHPALKKQLGLGYRFFGVFVENGKWRRLLRHPLLATVMYVDRLAVGLTYLLNR